MSGFEKKEGNAKWGFFIPEYCAFVLSIVSTEYPMIMVLHVSLTYQTAFPPTQPVYSVESVYRVAVAG